MAENLPLDPKDTKDLDRASVLRVTINYVKFRDMISENEWRAPQGRQQKQLASECECARVCVCIRMCTYMCVCVRASVRRVDRLSVPTSKIKENYSTGNPHHLFTEVGTANHLLL